MSTEQEKIKILLASAGQHFNAGNFAAAEAATLEILSLAPQSYSAHLNLANIYSQSGNPEAKAKADAIYLKLLQLGPGNIHAAVSFYNHLLRAERIADAIAVMEFWGRHGVPAWRQPDDQPCDAPTGASLAAPSAEYLRTLSQYATLHAQPDPNAAGTRGSFDGIVSFGRWVGLVRRYAARLGARRMLDYGGGKGVQYALKDLRDPEGAIYPDMGAYLDLDHVHCFDPGFGDDDDPQPNAVDLTISIDVLEHAPVEDLRWIVDRLFACARKGVFVVVANYPARKTLPDGRNVHITLRPGVWWARLFRDVAASYPQHDWRLIAYDGWLNSPDCFGPTPDLP